MVMNNLLSLVGLVTDEYIKWFDLKMIEGWESKAPTTQLPRGEDQTN